MNKSAKVRELLDKGLSVAQICKQVKVKPATVYTVRWQINKLAKFKRDWPMYKPKYRLKIDDAVTPDAPPVKDEVAHPEHYTYGGIETWDFIEAKNLSYHLASVVKYVSRAGKKEGNTELKDLKKAREHLDRRIKQLVDQYPV